MAMRQQSGLSLRLGAMAPALKTQLGGIGLSDKQIAQYQKDADAITWLSVRGLLAESQARQLRQALVGKIEKAAGK